jgi:hypothetical protein
MHSSIKLLLNHVKFTHDCGPLVALAIVNYAVKNGFHGLPILLRDHELHAAFCSVDVGLHDDKKDYNHPE